MNEQRRREIRAELARRMGWTCITGDVGFNPETSHKLAYCADAFKKAICSHMKKPLPDPFTNAADKDALVKLANAALIFIDIFAADKIDDEYNRVLMNPLKAAIAAAESEAAND